jgi:putative PIN family toxin of toxin-antitoxin system
MGLIVQKFDRIGSMAKPYQLIIDTNVLVSGLRSPRGASYQMLSRLKDDRWQLNLSVPLILEYETLLTRESANLNLDRPTIDRILNNICVISNHHRIFYVWRPVAKDPNDDFLIDLALKAQADYIITYNQKDLIPSTQRFGLQVVTPKAFLQIVGDI